MFVLYSKYVIKTFYYTKLTCIFQDRIPLRGEVNYPNVAFQTNYIDFGHIATGTNPFINIDIQNVSPLHVFFTWEWDEAECYFYELPPVEVTEFLFYLQNILKFTQILI